MAINNIVDILVTYFTGSHAVLGIFVALVFGFFILVITRDIRISSITAMPVLAFFVLAGWFGEVSNSEWIINLVLIIVSLFYAHTILKML